MKIKMYIPYLLCFLSLTSMNVLSKQLKQGILIAIEGIDGAGKSTLARSVTELLRQHGFDVVLTKEPGDSELGQEIRQIIQVQDISITSKAEYLLFAADRAQHFAEVVIPALEQNKLVISDRLGDSSLAYQGYGRGLDLSTLHTINQWAMEDITQHLTIFIRIPIKTALNRCKARGALSAYEDHEDFLKVVAHGFADLYRNQPHVLAVDGTESPEQLSARVCNAIEQWLKINNMID
jgi:dTMP kinase